VRLPPGWARPAAPTSTIGIRNDEIEMEILGTRSAFEFSHSLGH
jgi:hypothetical protein